MQERNGAALGRVRLFGQAQSNEAYQIRNLLTRSRGGLMGDFDAGKICFTGRLNADRWETCGAVATWWRLIARTINRKSGLFL